MRRYHSRSAVRYIRDVFILAVVMLLIHSGAIRADKDPYDWALVRLDYARQDKVAQLQHFCDRIHGLAVDARNDPVMINCFLINNEYNRLNAQAEPPAELKEKVMALRQGLNDHYLRNYLTFYDILFVNASGTVFYTIRNESDLYNNLITKTKSTHALQDCLRQKPQKGVFVDFYNYGPSAEPAAFFVEPVIQDDTLKGWIILQCAINKFNSLFAWTEDLGQTGETFLVNQQGYMLTESNFEGASTILSRHLDNRNIKAKFTEKQGHRMVTDYRGFDALTSFKVVPYMDTQWLVVAKVDKDEVLTDHFVRHRRYCTDKLLDHLQEGPIPPSRDISISTDSTNKVSVRVDIDEFIKAEQNQCLRTFGVATCTGFLAIYPDKFAYLAHISPRDKVYGAEGANLLGQMLKRMRIFDMYPCEKRKVNFVVVATHLESLPRIIDKIVDEGYLLSQIQVMYNQDARTASITYDQQYNLLNINWRMKQNKSDTCQHTLQDAINVGTIIEHIINLDETDILKKVSVEDDRQYVSINTRKEWRHE